MPITLNHTIVPSRDKEAGAQFIARMLGVPYHGLHGHFAPVQVNETLTLDFDDAKDESHHHYAFHVDDQVFDEVLGRVQAEGVKFGSQPGAQDNGEINNRRGGRGFYFRDSDGHSWELLTRT